jgi:IS4 transposase
LAALPEVLVLREVRYDLSTPGFRTRQITLVTTLLDAEVYRVADLAELYRPRWQVEISQPHYGSRESLSLAAA